MQLPKSAKELEKILHEYEENCRQGIFLDSEFLGEQLKERALNDDTAPPIAKFLASIDKNHGAMLVAISRYWDFREQVNQYQKANNISSVKWSEEQLKAYTIRYPIICDQLEIMPQDIEICRRHRFKVRNKFLKFIENYNLPLFEETKDEQLIPTDQESVKIVSEFFPICSINSWENIPVPDGTSKGNKIAYYVNRYSLFFGSADLENGRYFVAEEKFSK
jgi:hypothetical protein